ncbi:MAG: hypothetical protein J0J01_05375 [Reyranella sp.]|uniref:hypothetical protein n=1 Tax=Reyranella sp. TaxID=1929291 RepID=UPI001ACE05D6|nr:hypothetical protein [Reyranella sp.]MBN9086317.1 hypothetical protein [Reyranella sp.]
MSTRFEIPEWLPEEPAPALPPVDDHRLEGLINRFIAGKQEALFTAPDAFYRARGGNAVDGAPAIADRLQALRFATLDQARDDGERLALGPRLDLHVADAMDGINRHITAQRAVHQRQVLAERRRLIRRAAELEPDNDDKIDGLAEAQASAAQALARLDGIAPGSPEEAAAQAAARSQILRAAIEQRIGAAMPDKAVTLYDRVKAALSPADRRALELPLGVATDEAATDAWLAREAGRDGAPLADRAGLDDTLTNQQRLILHAKIGARESAEESRRFATVKGLDDQLAAATATLATQPSLYRPGTLSQLAEAYAGAGAPEKADETRRLALWERYFLPFAQADAAAQQRHLENLTGPERAMVEAILRHQQEAFARDPYAAGTALYPDVGPPLPEEDVEGRRRQVRMIEAMRGSVQLPPTATTPVNGTEADFLQNRAVWTDGASAGNTIHRNGVQRVEATPDDFRPIGSASEPNGRRVGTGTAQVEPAPDSEVYRAADAEVRRRQEIEAIDTDRMITEWMARASQPDYQPRNIPPSLEKRLSPEQKESINRIMSAKPHKLQGLTDPALYTEIRTGLTSSDSNERALWARKPLYQYRLSLSPEDFARLATLQSTISPGTGYLRTGKAGQPIGSLEDHAKVALVLATLLELPAWVPAFLKKATETQTEDAQETLKAMIRRRHLRDPGLDHSERGTYSPPNTEPLPGSREYQAAEDELHQLQRDDPDRADAPSP